MKKPYLFLIACSIAQLSFAQIQKGSILLEGTVSFYQQKIHQEFSVYSPSYVTDFKYTNTQFGFHPKAGQFITNTLLLGVGLSYVHKNYDYDTNSEKGNYYSIGPYIKKFIPLRENLYLTLSGNTYIEIGKEKYTTDIESKTNIFSFQVSAVPGVSYFVYNRLAISASLGYIGYNHQSEKAHDYDDVKNSSNNFQASFNFSTLSLGVQYLINRKE